MNIDERFDSIIDSFIENAELLIKFNYWDNLTVRKLHGWLSNFKSREEKYLAAAILNSIIFRSEKAKLALSENIFHILLPQILEENDVYTIKNIKEWINDLNGRSCRELPFRFAAINNVDGRAVKSGEVILSAIQKQFFESTLTVSLDAANSLIEKGKIKALIFFDDIIGTGTQFKTFYEKSLLSTKKIKVFYIPFVAVANSYKDLESEYENLFIRPVEVIDASHMFFSKNNIALNVIDSLSHEDFKAFYLNLCRKNKINIDGNLGKGNLELTYVFNNSTPNNNLSILVHHNDQWNQLFKR
ncbi:hypothetical protein [Erwinia sp. 198]|uniref:phosphoribosyltransferase-like protein n=1 Tax=Erwinia sp. 198 TaxID=2022746 RepID=UPI000F666175|nr:hypothetical protein [Erwinia sp. 198]RRZ86995.1 hypothetical protein EGK14_20070 [Erwinia sp. 198]